MDNPNQQPEPTDPVLAKLVKQIAAIEQDPSNRTPAVRLWRLTPNAQKKIDKLRRKVTDRLAELRAERGEPISEAGCTGPKQKKEITANVRAIDQLHHRHPTGRRDESANR